MRVDSNTIQKAARHLWLVWALTAAFACAADAGPVAAPPGAATGSAYALVSLVWSDDGPTGYVALTDRLDVDGISLRAAREFPGYTSVAVAAGQLLVSPSAEDPTIERYRIDDELGWEPTGSLSFTNEGIEEVGFYRQYLGARMAYLDVDVLGRVLWDPTDLALRPGHA